MKSKGIFISERFERFVLLVIIVNSVAIFLQEGGLNNPIINTIDLVCTLFFIIEMVAKHKELGVKGYWSSGWNIMDGIIVIISIPSLISYILPSVDLSFVQIIRVLRIFRFMRLIHLFPNFAATMRGLGKALKDSFPIFIGFVLLICIFSLLSCVMFRNIAPKYFATPWDSVYSIFRLCTVEGWYEIPDALASQLSVTKIWWMRVYFVAILIIGGIIGLSLVNSIFVDAMVSDNNDELESEVKNLSKKIDDLTQLLSNQRAETGGKDTAS